jgi:hypothetical protein
MALFFTVVNIGCWRHLWLWGAAISEIFMRLKKSFFFSKHSSIKFQNVLTTKNKKRKKKCSFLPLGYF